MKKHFIRLALPIIACSFLASCNTDNTPKYTVTWVNSDGTVLEVDKNVKSGTMPSYDSATPNQDDVEHLKYYLFTGWSPALSPVTSDQTYEAKYDEVNPSIVKVDVPAGTPINFTYDGYLGQVDWGDDIISGDHKHIYAGAGTYTIKIYGRITSLKFRDNNYVTEIRLANIINKITNGAYSGDESLTSIDLPEGITLIDANAFSGCIKLETIKIPNSVTSIGNKAFEDCASLKSLEIPPLVTSIGMGIIDNCTSLATLKVAQENTTYTSRNKSKEECNVIIESATHKLVLGFQNTIPIDGSVTIIGSAAFQRSSITSINVPVSVTEIDSFAFRECKKLTTVVLTNSITSIGVSAFAGCESLSDITLPSNLTKIADRTFEDCKSLTSIDIPKNVTSLGAYAFQNCEKLTNVTFSQGSMLEDIGDRAFYNCSEFVNIVIPVGVKTIGNNAFEGCSKCKTIEISKTVESIGQATFKDCPVIETIMIDEGNKFYTSKIDNTDTNAIIEKSTYDLIQGCKNTNILPGVKSIHERAFEGCQGITTIDIPASITSIGQYAFSKCTSLKTLNFAKDDPEITSIEEATFEGCTSIEEVYIPASVTKIGSRAFAGCSSISKITVAKENKVYTSQDKSSAEYNIIATRVDTKEGGIPEAAGTIILGCSKSSFPNDGTATIIGNQAFSGCNSSEFVLPESIEKIESFAFRDCINLTSITLQHKSVVIGDSQMFIKCSALESILVPPNLVDVYKQAEPWNLFANMISAING